MPSADLSELILATREEILTFSTDLAFRDGNSTDPRNGEVPVASVSITRQINKAISDILIASRFNLSLETLAIVSGTKEYSIPTSWLDVLSVYYTTGNRLMKTNVTDLDEREPKWRSTANGTAKRFYLNGTSKIGFDPTPNSSFSMNCLVVKDFTPLSVSTDVLPFYPTVFSYLISTRAAWHCAKLDSANPVAQIRAGVLDDNYKLGIKELQDFIAVRMAADADAPRSFEKAS